MATTELKLALLFCMLMSSCEVINPEEEIPAYIRINDFSLTTDPLTEGDDTENIRDVWVYVNNDILGIYELPAEFPVLEVGDVELAVAPGILLNGIAATRAPYPFYKFHLESAALIPGTITEILPATTYFEDVKFKWLEDFESSGFTIDKTSRSDTVMFKINMPDTNIMYGNGCGAVYMQEQHFLSEFESSFVYSLPKGGADVFLELDYKNNHPFVVGITAIDGTTEIQQSILTVTPKNKWNKIYVDLTPYVSSATSANSFKVFFRIIREQSYPAPVVFFDNIKVVHE